MSAKNRETFKLPRDWRIEHESYYRVSGDGTLMASVEELSDGWYAWRRPKLVAKPDRGPFATAREAFKAIGIEVKP